MFPIFIYLSGFISGVDIMNIFTGFQFEELILNTISQSSIMFLGIKDLNYINEEYLACFTLITIIQVHECRNVFNSFMNWEMFGVIPKQVCTQNQEAEIVKTKWRTQYFVLKRQCFNPMFTNFSKAIFEDVSFRHYQYYFISYLHILN